MAPPVQPTTPEQGGIELVDRARLGDQNAAAMLIRVRENAQKGVERAKRAYGAAMAHARGQRPPSAPAVHGDPLQAMKRAAKGSTNPATYLATVRLAPFAPSRPAAEMLSRGPLIGKDVLSFIGSTFGSEPEKRAYEYGVIGPDVGVEKALMRSKPQYRRAIMTGHIVGLARRLQAARAGNIAAISPKAAWELT